MLKKILIKTLVLMPLLVSSQVFSQASGEAADPFVWLEDVEAQKSMDWVNKHNERSLNKIKQYAGFDDLASNALEILNSKDRIPYAYRNGDFYYNFWKDDKNPRGVYRRTPVAEYLQSKPKWEPVLDIDALGKKEDINWVYKGATCLEPEYNTCMIALSRGGADAVEYREFDRLNKIFVKNGFYLPNAKSNIDWLDKDQLLVGTDFKDGESFTDSGYPRKVKVWQRGTKLSAATTIYTSKKTSVSTSSYSLGHGDDFTVFVADATDFYNAVHYSWVNGKLIKLPLPSDVEVEGFFKGRVYVMLKSDWKFAGKTFKQGSVISSSLASYKQGKPDFTLFVEPSERKSISGITFSKNAIMVVWLDDVKNSVKLYKPNKGGWQVDSLSLDDKATLSIVDSNYRYDDFLVAYSSFVEPSSLYQFNDVDLNKTKIQSMPAMFDSSKFKVEQFKASSKDGTKVPYFVVMAKDIKFDGKNPTLLYGYGGFEISLLPRYSATIGKNWLEQGGVYVLSNIRGGGEYGPAWHQAALKQNRHKAYEDFEAIAEDLISRKITSSKHLGIQGGSNGGLLMGNAFTRRPELYSAVVCQVPLLDMKRYNKLLAGASWMAEYGNPDIAEEWKYIKTFSPYHNVDKAAKYPKVFFTTSTRDDRVHPGHARKMVALMESLGHDVLYYENIEGGHAGAADNKQRAELTALTYAYLLKQLK